MSMKEILVHLDNSDRCQARLEVAITLASRCQAHLTGIYATAHPFSAAPRADSPPRVAEIESGFRQRAETAGIATDWLNADATKLVEGVSERLLLQSHFADLSIVGQADPAAGSHSAPVDLPEQLVLGSGRPVLVIPRTGAFETIGQRVMLAWRGGMASSRALNDAIPLLEKAKQVNLLMVNPEEYFEKQAGKLNRYLAHHGISASIDKLSAEDIRVGDILLNQACDLEIDLVIMGVFAHRKRGKSGLGPVGKHFLEHMTIPVLMTR
jgi:nucleotide-binding universal stress UspA family protein